MKRSNYVVSVSLVLAILVIGTDARAREDTRYDAQDESIVVPSFPPLLPRAFLGSMDTIDIELVALSLVSVGPVDLGFGAGFEELFITLNTSSWLGVEYCAFHAARAPRALREELPKPCVMAADRLRL